MDDTTRDARKRHPIEVAARRSGLTKDVLRAWERRYQAVTPGRTPSGRRLYSDDDVDRLRLLAGVTSAGRSISSVAGRPTAELAELAREDRDVPSRVAVGGSASRGGMPARAAADGTAAACLLEDCLAAVEAVDPGTLHAVLQRALLTLGPLEFIQGLAGPLMRLVGDRWVGGALDPGQERVASNGVREALWQMIGGLQPGAPVGKILVATPSGQRHELGAMLAAATAAADGWEVLYLGADLPMEDIARAAERAGVEVVALSLVFPTDDPDLPDAFARLRSLLPGMAILVGGRAAEDYAGALHRCGIEVVSSLAALRDTLAEVGGDGPGRQVRECCPIAPPSAGTSPWRPAVWSTGPSRRLGVRPCGQQGRRVARSLN